MIYVEWNREREGGRVLRGYGRVGGCCLLVRRMDGCG